MRVRVRGCLLLGAAIVLGSVTSQQEEKSSSTKAYRIAVIVGGISGTFVSKYLVDYVVAETNDNNNCAALGALDLYDPVAELGAFTTKDNSDTNTENPHRLQSSRVSTYRPIGSSHRNSQQMNPTFFCEVVVQRKMCRKRGGKCRHQQS